MPLPDEGPSAVNTESPDVTGTAFPPVASPFHKVFDWHWIDLRAVVGISPVTKRADMIDAAPDPSPYAAALTIQFVDSPIYVRMDHDSAQDWDVVPEREKLFEQLLATWKAVRSQVKV